MDTKKYTEFSDYIKKQIINEVRQPLKTVEKCAETWMQQEWEEKDMRNLIIYTLQGFWDAISKRMKNPYISDEERTAAEKIDDLISKLGDVVNE